MNLLATIVAQADGAALTDTGQWVANVFFYVMAAVAVLSALKMVTTFAVVSGVAGADLGTGIILILGLANLFADGFSMATGAYLSSKSEQATTRIKAPSNSLILVVMIWAIKNITSSGILVGSFSIFFFSIATRVSKSGG